MSGLTTNVGVNSNTQLVNQIQVIAQVDQAQTTALANHEDRLTKLESSTDSFSAGGSTAAKVAGGATGLAVGAAILHQSSGNGLIARLGEKIAKGFAPATENASKFKQVLGAVGEKVAKVAGRISNLGAAAAVATLGIATYAGVKIAGALSNKSE